MNLTRRERSQLIFILVCLNILIVLIIFFDFFMGLIIPSDGSMFSYFRYLLIMLVIVYVIFTIWILKPRKITPDVIESAEIPQEKIKQELKNVGILPEGEVLMIIPKVGYSDPVYARKIIRAWPWREKGRLILTGKELIFNGKKIHFSVAISDINSIHSFVGRSGARSYKLCEVLHGNYEKSAILMGCISFGAFDPPSELELKSMKLMETLQKWYDSYKFEI